MIPKPHKNNKLIYAISVFLALAILGMFIDDNDECSLIYFQNNLDTDTVIGLGFFLVIWVYFLSNSSILDRNNNK